MTSLLPTGIARDIHPPRTPDGPIGEPTLETWQDAPHNRWAFAHVAEFVPTAPIAHRQAAPRFGAAGAAELAAALPGIDARLEQSYTDALVVVRRGEVVAEYYREGIDAHTPHLLMSVSKSICGLTVGTLVDDGLVELERRIDEYVPARSRSSAAPIATLNPRRMISWSSMTATRITRSPRRACLPQSDPSVRRRRRSYGTVRLDR